MATMKKTSRIPLARNFALKAHGGMIVRTASGLERPQILHLQEVADLVWASGGSDIEIAAAWLHDVVEDTPVTLDTIAKEFGNELAELVEGMTDPIEIGRLTLPERKKYQARRIGSENASVRRMKIADQISNVRSLIDPTIEMTMDEYAEYVEGAMAIASECKGVSAMLDALFAGTYEDGKEWIAARRSV